MDIIQVQTVAGVKIPISVLIVPKIAPPKIAPPMQNLLHTSLQNIPYLKGLQLVYPVIDNKNFGISVLTIELVFTEDHVIRESGPTAM